MLFLYKNPQVLSCPRPAAKDNTVRKETEHVRSLWITNSVPGLLLNIHSMPSNGQLLSTLSSELKSRVSSLLVDLRRAILRQACRTVV